MFWHNFKYSFKALFKNKMLIFWTFAFPILLGLFFYMAFKDIEKNQKLDIIPIAIVETEEFENNLLMKEAFKTLSAKNNSEAIFKIEYATLEEAKELLNQKEIIGFLNLENNETKIVVKKSGIDETILKYVTEEIESTSKVIENISNDLIKKEIENGNTNIDYERIYKEVSNLANEKNANIKDFSSKNLSYTMIEYYTLIAMTCLYGGILGLEAISSNLANTGAVGKRKSVTPIKKGKLLFSSVLASYVIELIGASLLLLFLYFVLKVDFGSNPLFVILLTISGCLAGLSLGVGVATLIKASENTKTGIIITLTMIGSFFSGMMGITMKYIIDKNIPFLNLINPANMITDGFYSLYYYNTYYKFFFNIVSLLLFSSILLIISSIALRRQKYDNI